MAPTLQHYDATTSSHAVSAPITIHRGGRGSGGSCIIQVPQAAAAATAAPRITKPVQRVLPLISAEATPLASLPSRASSRYLAASASTATAAAATAAATAVGSTSGVERVRRRPAIYGVYGEQAATASSAAKDARRLFAASAPKIAPPLSAVCYGRAAADDDYKQPLFAMSLIGGGLDGAAYFGFESPVLSIGDIIGYANVVRAQRKELLAGLSAGSGSGIGGGGGSTIRTRACLS